jgi:hypothetical protein
MESCMGCLKSGKARDNERNNYKNRNMIPKKKKNNKRMDDNSSEETEGNGLSPGMSQSNPYNSTTKKMNSDSYRYSDVKKDHSFLDRTPSSGGGIS